MTKRPEDPALDSIQLTDLKEFLSTLTPDQLRQALVQTQIGATGDVPANTNKAYNLIRKLLGDD